MNIQNSRQAFMEDSSFWKRAQTHYCTYRQRRRICERRLIDFRVKKAGDYHEEMDGNRFEAWFKSILRKVGPGSVIVMDNASNHSRRLELPTSHTYIPTSASRKSVVMDWLASKRIPHEETMLKTGIIIPGAAT